MPDTNDNKRTPFSLAFRAWWHDENGVDPGLGTPTAVEPGYPHPDMRLASETFEAGRARGDREVRKAPTSEQRREAFRAWRGSDGMPIEAAVAWDAAVAWMIEREATTRMDAPASEVQ